jgi:putative toxin-antitoxin system antitoxin component (TIGR02293 family)
MEADLKGGHARSRGDKPTKAGGKARSGKSAGAHDINEGLPNAVRRGRPAPKGRVEVIDLTHFGAVYRVDRSVRIDAIKRGVKADDFVRIARFMDRSKEQLGKTLGLSIPPIDRKAKAGEKLSPEQGERVVGMAKLIGQVQTMVEESGDPTGFDAAQWLARWLDEPLPALDGKRPAEYMDTAEGRDLVSNLLAMAQSGAYA